MEYIETIIIGGGQAGLASGYFLLKEKREHIVLEKSSYPVNAWRNERWDSFSLTTPNWTVKIPDTDISSYDRESFMPRDELVKIFDDFISRNKIPLKLNAAVTSVEEINSGFRVSTDDHSYKAKNVIIAAGYWQKPRIPQFSFNIDPGILQLHSTQYKNPGKLPDGAVLVAGSGQSGCQIAEDLIISGKKTYLSTGSAGRVPRRYRGKDSVEWLQLLGFFELTPAQFPPGKGKFDANPHVTGARGGKTINLHQFAHDGVRLLGHFKGAEGSRIFFAPTLHENLRRADQADMNFRNMVDNFIMEKNIDAPPEEVEMPDHGFRQPLTEVLDLKDENITTIIWAGGYTFDYSWIRLPVFGPDGYPEQDCGVTKHPGLYFAGIPWTPTFKEGLLLGLSSAAEHITRKIISDG